MENEKKKLIRVSMNFDQDTLNRLRYWQDITGMNRTKLINRALDTFINRLKRENLVEIYNGFSMINKEK